MRSGLCAPSLHELQFCSPITPTRVPDNMFMPAAQKVHSREMTVDLYWPAIQYVKHALSVLEASVGGFSKIGVWTYSYILRYVQIHMNPCEYI